VSDQVSDSRAAFLAVALAVLALELLALGHQPLRGPSTAEIEGILARDIQVHAGPVSDVRCARPADDVARCVALMYDGTRTRVAATVDSHTGRVAPTLER